MSIPSTGTPIPSHRRLHWRLPKIWRRRQAAADAGNLTLLSVGTGVPLGLVEHNPALLHLAVEDLCWRLAVADLHQRRPRHGQDAARAAWRAEQARLEAKRLRLVELASEAVSAL